MTAGLFDRYRHIGDGYFVTESDVWGVFALPPSYHTYDEVESYEEHATAVTQAINSIFPDDGSLRIQVRTVRVPFDVYAWKDRYLKTISPRRVENNPVIKERLDRYVERVTEHLNGADFLDRQTYLLVHLDTHTEGSVGAKQAMAAFWRTLRGSLAPVGLPAEAGIASDIAEKYEDRAYETAEIIDAKLPGTLTATTQEIIALIRAPFARRSGADGIPDLDTFPADAIASVIDEQVTFGRDVIHHQCGVDGDFYSAFVSIGKFPDYTNWPQQMSWFSIAQAYAADAEVVITADVISAREVMRRLKGANTKTKEQLEDAVKFDTTDADHYAQHSERVNDLIERVQHEGNGWIEMTCRMQITADTAEELIERRRRITKELREYGYIVYPDRYEQKALLAEAMPGGTWKNDLHALYYDLGMLGATGCLLAYDVGDDNRAGMYLGYTLDGDSTPVFLDPNRATQTNNPPGVLISGRPGVGKTFSALTLAWQAYVSGKTLVYIDPKADSEPLARWLGVENINHINVTDAQSGLLDPFVMAAMLNDEDDPKLAHNVVVAVSTMLTGTSTERAHKDAIQTAVHEVIDDSVKNSTTPTMTTLVNHLLAKQDSISRSLGAELSGFASDTYGRLLFSTGGAKLEKAAGAFTIIVMNGLSLPPSDTPREEYTPENRVAMSVFYMTMMLAQRLMMLDALSEGDAAGRRVQTPKVIIMDEAWALFTTPEGRASAKSILKLGRSMNTAFIMGTQQPGDIPSSSTYISTYLAFRPGEEKIELESLGESLRITDGARRVATSLERGTCLMRDAQGRRNRIRVDPWDAELFAAIDTTPGE